VTSSISLPNTSLTLSIVFYHCIWAWGVSGVALCGIGSLVHRFTGIVILVQQLYYNDRIA